ncbi:MAG: hypothetical protein RLZZ306_2261 [Bacteroidota bacterium]|jgi:hypothetical protein
MNNKLVDDYGVKHCFIGVYANFEINVALKLFS